MMEVEQYRAIDPLRLTLLLEQADWRIVGGREGVYHRLTAPDSEYGGRAASVLIPLDQGAPEFDELMQQVTHDLRRNHSDTWTRLIAPLSRIVASDSMKFRRESAAPSGLIPWTQGQALIEAARATLVAGAKSFMQPARQYSNRYGTFANRFLDKVLMGQTAPGSYIVTALIPTEVPISLHGKDIEAGMASGPEVALGREVTLAVTHALEAAVASIEDYRQTASIQSFIENVPSGISYELVKAVSKLARGADESDVTLEWSSFTSPSLVDSATPRRSEFSFSPADAEVLTLAANDLAVVTEAPRFTARGRVHLLTKKDVGGPGVIGIDAGDRKFRARFDSDLDYHEAVRAHDNESHVEVIGDLSREGQVSWLYRARLARVYDEQETSLPHTPMFD